MGCQDEGGAIMKVLSIRQPWAHLIVTGLKRIENRTWNTDYRGPLLIHASQRFDSSFQPTSFGQLERLKDEPRGAIIGRVDLIDVVTESSDPSFEGPFGFVLRNPKPIRPHPMKGRLGLFDIDW